MNALIALSEVARNVTLPAVAILGIAIAFWQARMAKRKNGFAAVSKAAELYNPEDVSKRIAAYALLLEATNNSENRRMASSVFWSYLWSEKKSKCFAIASDWPRGSIPK